MTTLKEESSDLKQKLAERTVINEDDSPKTVAAKKEFVVNTKLANVAQRLMYANNTPKKLALEKRLDDVEQGIDSAKKKEGADTPMRERLDGAQEEVNEIRALLK